MAIPTSLVSDDGVEATIVPKEGKWQVRVERANGQPRKVLYSNASAQAAQHRMADFLGIPAANIIVHYAESSTRTPRASRTTPVTPPRSSFKSTRPFDTFEPRAPTSQAICRACKELIRKDTERIGIQRQFSQSTGWKPHYYHRKCVSNETILELKLPEDTNKRKRNEEPTTPDKKLRCERERQMYIDATKRSLVYSKRKDLRRALHHLRTKLAKEQNKQPPCVVFDNAAIDDIVIKLPSNESQLLKCHGIGNRRCQDYGQAILDVVDKYRWENE